MASSLNDESLLLEFVIESREHLLSIEPDLLVMERDGAETDADIINRVFRAIHSIKGAAGFFGLEAVKSLGHCMENVLMLVRDGKLLPSPLVMDPLLLGVDRLRSMLDDIQASEQVVYQDLVDQLENVIHGGPNTSAPVQISTVEGAPKDEALSYFNPDRIAVESAVRNGQTLYSLKVFMDGDLSRKDRNPLQFMDTLLGVGIVLDTMLDISGIPSLAEALSSPLPLRFLYASVLELDLLPIAFDIPAEQISRLQVNELFGTEASNEVKTQSTESAQASDEKQTTTTETPKKQPKNTAGGSVDSNESIRVKVELLNRLMDLAGELVLARNQLTRAFQSHNQSNSDLGNIIQNVDLVTSDLQEHIMQTRMQPISSVFGKFPRVVRDLAKQLHKEIGLEMTGEEVELDKSILENLSDPLTHLIRNCCDHALEKPDVREKNGKPKEGSIFLRAYQESGHLNIEVVDDGAGIDHEVIAQKALEKGLLTEATLRQLSPQEQVNLIFAPGFSTAEKVTDVSGRGVGMDVVRTNIEQIGGSINIETEKGKGTTITLRLPLTLAIVPSLVVSTADQVFAVPQINLVELVCVTTAQISSRIEKVGSASVLRLRGKLLPLIRLSDVLGLEKYYLDPQSQLLKVDERETIHDQRLESTTPAFIPERRINPQGDYNILVLKSGNREYGLIVDEIKDIEEIVVKPLSQFLKSCKCFSGATIMGDGRVAMILDVGGLIGMVGLSFGEVAAEEEKRNLSSKLANSQTLQGEKKSSLLFHCAPGEIFAISLESILRLEKIKLSSVEKLGNQRFLPYKGLSMKLLFLDEHLPVSPIQESLEEVYLIIPKGGNSKAGIIASSIIDTVDVAVEKDGSIKHPGVLGSAVINEHITLVLSSEGLLSAAGLSYKEDRSAEWPADPLQLSY
ncbi:chemotaxis protein CheA [Vampirovibrio sp.]|uniref:chemotaxis protein CheA n=1 Tax=Vampirovibrio sp. TaxID=2717857 RepID=UPI0035938DD7